MSGSNVPVAIAHVVTELTRIGDGLIEQNNAIEKLQAVMAVDAMHRNMRAVEVVANIEKAGSLLASWTLCDRRHVSEIDGVGSSVYVAGEDIKRLAMEFAQHYWTVEQQLKESEYRNAVAKDRVREHSTSNSIVREEVFNSTGGLCFYCEAQLWDASYGPADGLDPARQFHIDHIVPKTHGGPDHISNYVPACQKCNSSKSDRPFVQYLKRRSTKLRVINGGSSEEDQNEAVF